MSRFFQPVKVDNEEIESNRVFSGRCPSQAAKKVYSRMSKQKPGESVIAVRETTPNSCQKTFRYVIHETGEKRTVGNKEFPMKKCKRYFSNCEEIKNSSINTNDT